MGANWGRGGGRECCDVGGDKPPDQAALTSRSDPGPPRQAMGGMASVASAGSHRNSCPGQLTASEATLESLCAGLEDVTGDLDSRYRQATLRAKASSSSKKTVALDDADEAIARVVTQLRRLQRMRVRQTWQGPEADNTKRESKWTQMYAGERRRFKSMRDLGKKVQETNRIIKHWQDVSQRGKQEKKETDIVEHETQSEHTAHQVHTWFSLDIFEVDRITQKPLTRIFMSIWIDRKFDDLCKVNREQALDYVNALESTYYDHPYHNRIHAADVTATSFYMLTNFEALDGMEGYVCQVDVLAMMLAASCHDVAHPAVNNDFLARTRHEFALRYNDRSILENFHVATAFELMRELKIDMLSHNLLSPPPAALRSRIIDMVLSTDMAHHKPLYEELVSELSANESKPQDVSKITLEKNILHTSDIGHPLRPFKLHVRWSERINEEFLAQGDQEKLQGIEPIALFDRDKAPPMPKGQLGFINFVVLPAWKPLRLALGSAAMTPDRCLQANISHWEELAKEHEVPAEPETSQCRCGKLWLTSAMFCKTCGRPRFKTKAMDDLMDEEEDEDDIAARIGQQCEYRPVVTYGTKNQPLGSKSQPSPLANQKLPAL